MSEVATKSAPIAKPPQFKPEDYKRPANLVVLKQMGASIQSSIADALPGFLRKSAPAMLRALYTECQKTPGLMNCTPESLFGCTIAAAQMGLQLGGALGQCYLIPFKGRATLIPGYKGYIQLVNRSSQVGVINAFTVFDKDTFAYEYGTQPRITHKPGEYPTLTEVYERKAVAYYATCTTKQGPTFVVMTRAEAEFHRDKFALAKNGPWHNHFDAMAMKTCIIKLCKYLPMSAELQTAINHDEMLETDDPVDASFLFHQAIGEDDTPPPTSKTVALENRLIEARTSQTEPLDDTLINLIAELEAIGGLPNFLERHGKLIEDLTGSKNASRSKWCSAINDEIRSIKASQKKPTVTPPPADGKLFGNGNTNPMPD